MKTTQSSLSKATKLFTLQSLILSSFLFIVSEAWASYEECNQILAQDIFNRTTDIKSSNATARATAFAIIFQMDEHEAFNLYSKQYDESKERVETGEGGLTVFNYFEADGSGSVTNKQKLSEDEFSKAFNKAKHEYRNQTGSETSSSQNMMSNYASYVRDPGTVQAWKECVTKSKDTNLYAFASRDNSGEVYVNVMWVPGALAGSVPSIPISFVTHDEAGGVKIHAKPEEQIAMGSGRHYAVDCGKKCDNGFQVFVNGTIKNVAGIPTNDFTTTVEVPPLNPPPVPKIEINSQLCKELEGRFIFMKATNLADSTISSRPGGIKLFETIPGRFEFKAVAEYSPSITNKEIHPIVGVCQNDKITFSRELPNNVTQNYTGQLRETTKNQVEMAGDYLQNGNSYSWMGSVRKFSKLRRVSH